MNPAPVDATILSEDLHLPPDADGVRLHLRRKVSASAEGAAGRRVVLFVHGATFSGVVAFDTPLPGGSWLDYAARHGCEAYALDIRGYGLSRPAARRSRQPYARTSDAIADLGAAVDFVLERTGVERVDLVGWSWGTAICGGYAGAHKGKVRHLVMFAPLWTFQQPAWAGLVWWATLGPLYSAGLEGFRTVTLADARRRWFQGLDERTARALCPPEALQTWWDHAMSVEASTSRPASCVTAPAGVLADLMEFWAAGSPTYDPADIAVPTLAVVGEWDADTPLYMAQQVFARLTSAPYKRLEVLGRGSHSMSLEINRFDLYGRVQQFLDASFESS